MHDIVLCMYQLIGQYLALRKPNDDPDTVGLISSKASPYLIAQEVRDLFM